LGETRRDKVKKKILQTNRLQPHSDNGFGEHDQDRCNINGFWYNQLGSELYINQTDESSFCGEYRTAVEVDQISENVDLMGVVRGKIIGQLFTFNVFFKNGESVATWTGQCHKPCDMGYFSSDHTTLHTHWMLTSRVESCGKHWMSNRIGQDIFTRDSTIMNGPRRSLSDQEGQRI
jgi:hypothetical protein